MNRICVHLSTSISEKTNKNICFKSYLPIVLPLELVPKYMWIIDPDLGVLGIQYLDTFLQLYIGAEHTQISCPLEKAPKRGEGETLSYSWKINAVLCPQRVFLLLKKTPWRQSCLSSPVGCDSPLQEVMTVLCTFIKKILLAGSGVAARCWLYSIGCLVHFKCCLISRPILA